jgi:hypothetical protein
VKLDLPLQHATGTGHRKSRGTGSRYGALRFASERPSRRFRAPGASGRPSGRASRLARGRRAPAAARPATGDRGRRCDQLRALVTRPCHYTCYTVIPVHSAYVLCHILGADILRRFQSSANLPQAYEPASWLWRGCGRGWTGKRSAGGRPRHSWPTCAEPDSRVRTCRELHASREDVAPSE